MDYETFSIAPSWCSFGGTEENREKYQPRQFCFSNWISPRYEPHTTLLHLVCHDEVVEKTRINSCWVCTCIMVIYLLLWVHMRTYIFTRHNGWYKTRIIW